MVQDALLNAATASLRQAESPLSGVNLTTTDAKAAAEDFEAFFLAQMVNHMLAGMPTNSPFGGGHGETMFRSMLGQEYGAVLARNGGVGLGEAVTREIIRLQEQAQG